MPRTDLPVLYSFRRCPYAMRARMVLLLCAQEVELREVQLADKPPQMIQASAKSTVPVLCLADGRIVDESIDIMLWAIQRSKDPQQLYSVDREQQAQRELINFNDAEFKYWLDRYKYHVRYPQNPLEYYRHHAEQFLAALETRLVSTAYLFGEHPQLADIAIMPFVRQFAGVDKHWFDNSRYNAVKTWLTAWLNSPVFNNAMVKYPNWSTKQPVIVFGAADQSPGETA